MMRAALAIGSFVISSTVFASAAAQAASAIGGKWINPTRSVIIQIKPCGQAQCGTVVWASAQAKADARKGTARLVGTRLLTGLSQSGQEWQGQLFVPDENLRAKAKIKPIGSNRLSVSGCKLMICKSQTWTRTSRSRA